MELFLEKPSMKRKMEALEYLQEHVEYKSNLNGTGSMDRCLKGTTYEEWLEELKRRENFEYLAKIDRNPSNTYFVVRKEDNKIVGMINVRYKINKDSTHIGYGIRPTERRKGYAKQALYLGLLEEQKLGENEIILNCTIDNIGSNKVIEALGGVLEKTEIDSYDNKLTNYYRIDVNESVIKYHKIYE